MSATEVNYFSTMVADYYLGGGGGEPVEETEEEDLESLTRGLDQEATEQKFELDPSSVSRFSPASYASYHPESNQCRNIVLEARYTIHHFDQDGCKSSK